MESGDDGLESEANVRPRPCLTRVGLPRGSPGARWTAIDRGLFAGSTGASAAKSKRQGSRNRPFSTIPKMWKDSVRQAASGRKDGADRLKSDAMGRRADQSLRSSLPGSRFHSLNPRHSRRLPEV